ncbi:hypothetical protein BDW02DRAFT_613224, partial [Decorospora gaudefroyi]
LEFCSLPCNVSDIPIANEEISIFVKCHDRLFTNVTVVDEKYREHFIGGDRGLMKSWSWLQQVQDTSGLPIFDLRHHGWGMKNHWTVESPDGHHVADVKHVSSAHRSDRDMMISNGKKKRKRTCSFANPAKIPERDHYSGIFLKLNALLCCSSWSRTISPISVRWIGVLGRFELLLVWILPF